MAEWITKYWLEVLFGLLVSGAGVGLKLIYSRGKKREEEDKKVKAGTLALLHDKLYHRCNEYIAISHISTDELKNLEYLYDSYSALGGNGTCKKLYERCQSLEIIND